MDGNRVGAAGVGAVCTCTGRDPKIIFAEAVAEGALVGAVGAMVAAGGFCTTCLLNGLPASTEVEGELAVAVAVALANPLADPGAALID